MKSIFLVLLVFASSVSFSQTIEVVNFEELEAVIEKNHDKPVIYNFWATWCRPCLMELPHFKEAAEDFHDKVTFVFVSLDFENKKEKAQAALSARGFKGAHYLLKGDPNEWIDKIDPSWQGDIPYTFMVKIGGEKVFAPYVFESKDQLVKFINENI